MPIFDQILLFVLLEIFEVNFRIKRDLSVFNVCIANIRFCLAVFLFSSIFVNVLINLRHSASQKPIETFLQPFKNKV